MKPAAAFAVGLWTGALVMTAVGLVYFHWGAGPAGRLALPAQDQLAAQLANLNRENARLVAEAQRLRETVAEMRNRPVDVPVQRVPFRRRAVAAEVEPWILEAVHTPDAQSFPKLEQAALQNNLAALDALALLADRDQAEALVRVAASPNLNPTGRERAALLLGACVELNPHVEELLLALTGNDPALALMAVVGLETPRFVTRLGITSTPRIKADYALRLRILTALRSTATEESLVTRLEQAQAKISQRAGGGESP